MRTGDMITAWVIGAGIGAYVNGGLAAAQSVVLWAVTGIAAWVAAIVIGEIISAARRALTVPGKFAVARQALLDFSPLIILMPISYVILVIFQII